MIDRLEGYERGQVTVVDIPNGLVTATLLGGPEVLVPFSGFPPGVGQTAWFVEVAPGSLFCLGAMSPSALGWAGPWYAPWGLIPGGYVEITTNQSGITGAVDIAGLSITSTYVANRQVRLRALGAGTSTVGTDTLQILVTDTVPTTIATSQFAPLAATANAVASAPPAERVISPTAGAHTYKVRAIRAAGTGTMTFVASATVPASFSIEDVGPNGNPVLP